jgi:hypothetical protein
LVLLLISHTVNFIRQQVTIKSHIKKTGRVKHSPLF